MVQDDDVDLQITDLIEQELELPQNYMFGKMYGAPWTRKESKKNYFFYLSIFMDIFFILTLFS